MFRLPQLDPVSIEWRSSKKRSEAGPHFASSFMGSLWIGTLVALLEDAHPEPGADTEGGQVARALTELGPGLVFGIRNS